ncbi:MAG TPA: DUF3106 domain-containing protein [Phycisphaerae bacterium]|nr:DUF3106 domain-containing protein [Phycisphaerae bacterium]
MRWRHKGFLAAALICVTGVVAAGDPEPKERPEGPSISRPPAGSIAAQLRLAAKLRAIKGPTLAAALDHNRAEWEALSPDERSRFREHAVAFLNESPEQQERLLEQYRRLIQMSAERREEYRRTAKWLAVVAESFTAAERQALLQMPPEKRARVILERKAELIRRGVLPREPEGPLTGTPATMPAPTTGSTTQPTN